MMLMLCSDSLASHIKAVFVDMQSELHWVGMIC